MRIFHVAPRSGWLAALRNGSYRTPSLESDGHVGAAHRNQVAQVLERHADVEEPLVVLEIETDLLSVPWAETDVHGTTYPHVLGPVDTSAVIDVHRTASDAWASRGLPPLAPPVVSAFGGLAAVLGAGGLVLLFAAATAHFKTHPSPDAFGVRPLPSLPPGVEFLLWSLTIACLVAALAAWAVALMLRTDYRRRTAWRP